MDLETYNRVAMARTMTRTMQTTMTRTILAMTVAMASAACAVEEVAISTAASESLCPMFICGENAPTAGDNLIFDELDLFGRPNHAGVALIGANLGSTGEPVWLEIWGDELYAFGFWTWAWYSGYALIGTEIHLQRVPTGELFDLRLADYNRQTVRFLAGSNDLVPVYDFQARLASDPNKLFHVCNNALLATDETWSGLPHHALMYRGDKYDHSKKVVPNDPADGWAFLACNGSAATKMQLYRHTYSGGFPSGRPEGSPVFMTSLDERTALLKAITDDFCGTGAPQFTVAGTRLAFATAREPWRFPSPYPSVRSIEALWGPTGALCIDEPRLAAAGWPRADVENACGRQIPWCGSPAPGTPDPSWPWFSYVLTANPP